MLSLQRQSTPRRPLLRRKQALSGQRGKVAAPASSFLCLATEQYSWLWSLDSSSPGEAPRAFLQSYSSSSSSSSSMAKIRSEVLSPFRSVRMFFYLAFMASGGLGSLIALTQLIPALGNPARAAGAAETLKGLSVDVAAVALFAFLYSRDRKASDAQVARLTREENLSRLKLRVGEGGRVVPLNELRGSARLVIVAGPAEFVAESFRRSKPFLKDLMERGVLVLPFPTDGNTPALEFDERDGEGEDDGDETGKKSRRLWQLTPVYTSEWAKWLDEQKKLANVTPDSPVYLSLRMDGRVRGSGVGYPPWQAFVAQLPMVKGMWSGIFDGMDGRV